MIGFESEDVYVRRLRERLQAMGDEELINFVNYARNLAGIRVPGAGPVRDSTAGGASGVETETSEDSQIEHRSHADLQLIEFLAEG
jgi:hypothetical protein